MRTLVLSILVSLALLGSQSPLKAQQAETYAEKLGFPKGAKVVIIHVDDAGMSWPSNQGAEQAIDSGVATSTSLMMPCPWIPDMIHILRTHPQIDAGLHLTLTSEWSGYRWGPLAGQTVVPGLTDSQDCMWPSVAEVVAHASGQEVAREIQAQYQRAIEMGFHPTHLDSHMGTLFARPDYLKAYMELGIRHQVPVMLPGGGDALIAEQDHLSPAQVDMLRQAGQMLWNAGLPVLDDLHNFSYDWKLPNGVAPTLANLRTYKTRFYEAAIDSLKPGLTMIITHCTRPASTFPKITDSWPTRYGDFLTMTNPAFKAYLKRHGVILTTWRELMQRRKHLSAATSGTVAVHR